MSPKKNDETTRALNGLLGAVIGGHPDVQNHMNQTGKSLDEVLGSMSGGSAASAVPQKGLGSDMLGSLLGSALSGGGSGGGSSSQGSGGDLLGSLLGGALGGGTPSGGGTQSSNPTGDLLGSLLSGAMGGSTPKPSSRPKPSTGKKPRPSSAKPTSQQPAGGSDMIGSLLGGLLGTNLSGGASSAANNPIENAFLQPIVDAVAKKTGLSPQIAQIVVVFALSKLMSAATQGSGKKGSSMSDLVSQLSSGGSVSPSFLKDSGLAADLAQQSGLDQATAAKALQQSLSALGTHMGEGSMQEKQAALNAMLNK